MTQVALTALCFQLPHLPQSEGADSALQWMPMIPAGEAEGRDGRKWFNHDADAVIAASSNKIPFDVEHATEIKGPKGEAADAHGWIVALENRDGEIWAGVEWNEDGNRKLKGKNYIFYSPAFTYDSHGNVIALVSAGLTNKPNFYVPALNHSQNQLKENDMAISKALADALALSESATEQDAVTAIGTLKSAEQVALNRASQTDLTKFVPVETHEVALNRATTAEASLKQIEDRETEALVDAAIEDGKVAPANKEMYLGMCRQKGGAEKFKAFAETAPQIVSDKQTKTQVKTQGEELSKEEVALCRQMGVSEDSWKANRKHKPTY